MLQHKKILVAIQLVISMMTLSFILASNAHAAQSESVSCSVAVIGSATYTKTFVVQPDAPFFDDFSTFVRFKDFSAQMETVADVTTVTIDYYADISAFNSIEFGTTLTIPNNHHIVSSNGRTGFSSNSGNGSASYTINYKRN